MNQQQQSDLLRMPYRIGGRSSSGIDCLGVVLHILRLHKRPAIDPWRHLLQAYKTHDVDSVHAFGPDWQRIHEASVHDLQSMDVMLFHEAHSWSAIVAQDLIWSAHPTVGVWCKRLDRFSKTPHEVWRQAC